MPAVDLEYLGLQTLIEGLSREKFFLLFLPKTGGTIAPPAPQVPSALEGILCDAADSCNPEI